ncbi:replication-relaxation family protein [Streptomyces sviceus]|uniref:replication-relaxation family protein n=1 Tax=Streptomyces sviceus TaxID=285530 RepID=UPI00332D30EC
MATLRRVRLASGDHLERLHFAGLAPRSRPVVRRRVLARLTDWHVLTTFERRIGGVRAGSAGLVFALDKTGHLLMNQAGSYRTPPLPTERFWRHLLDVTELYVQLVELTAAGELRLLSYTTEPACWWRDSYGVLLKPDAHAVVEAPSVIDDWWIEVDRATESLPTLRRKLNAYVDFARTGQQGPGGVVPRVLVTVPTLERRAAVQKLINRLPAPGPELISVALASEVMSVVIRQLRQT